ncbi:unnamed protein product [Discosporangium mesarthrocarpum]
MKDNWEILLRGDKVVLVPYRREHVPKYHRWMQDPWIREMTASEPLSLEEEYAMQVSWREDPFKCTFIVLAKGEGDGEGEEGDMKFEARPCPEAWLQAMAGDVNLFFTDTSNLSMCEVEVMIAEERWRRKGLGEEAVLLLMRYALDTMGVKTFFCKIGDANTPSRRLFEKLGYKAHSYVEAFKETELRFERDDGGYGFVRSRTAHMEKMECPAPLPAPPDPAPLAWKKTTGRCCVWWR